MAEKWKLTLINPRNTIEVVVRKGWALALKDLEKWIKDDFVDILIYGGMGIQGIFQTDFYRFISSPEGLGQLGIESSQPPRLLAAYRKAFKTGKNNNTLLLRFGDIAVLKLLTPHPASGTGKLYVQSWLEWIIDGMPVNDAGYVPRARLSKQSQKRIRVRSSPGGLMLPRGVFGSVGTWRFPPTLQHYDMEWFNNNIGSIEQAIVHQMSLFLTQRLS